MTSTPPIPPTPPAAKDAQPKGTTSDTETEARAVTPLEGSTTIDQNMTFEVEALSHKAACDAATKIDESIASALKEQDKSTASPPEEQGEGTASAPRDGRRRQIIYLETDLARALQGRRAFLAQADMLAETFASAEEIAKKGRELLGRAPKPEEAPKAGLEVRALESVTAVPSAAAVGAVAALSGVAGPLAAGASAALATAVHLAGFFRQDTQYHGRKVTVTDRALVAELARLVNARPDTTFRWPHLGISERLFEDTEAVPSFLTAFQAATAAQSRAAVAVTDLAIAAQSLDEKDPRLQAARLALDRAHELLDSGSDILDSIRDALYSPDESGETLLQRLQLATDVAADVAANPSERFFLRIWVEAAGGSYRVRKSLWGSLLARDGLGFSGGVIVTFALLDHSGKLLTSGILTQRRAFTGFEQLSSQLE